MIITENFKKAPLEKQQAVINAAFTCFGKDGYDKTAMSEIAVMAGVSKSLLFHYFGTKKELYLYLFNIACNAIIAELQPGNVDFFDSLIVGMKAKLRVLLKHPGLYDYLLSITKEKNTALIEELKTVNNHEIEKSMTLIFADVDWNRFKPEYEKTEIMNLLRWIDDGCINQFADIMTGEEIIAEEERYLAIMKKALYKEEYL